MDILTPLLCLTMNLYHEARGDGERSQLAVAHVTMNRANREPKNVCTEVFRPYQFSWTIGTSKAQTLQKAKQLEKKKDAAYLKAKQIARKVLYEETHDITQGALYFHTPQVNPKWSRSPKLKKVARIGGHIYYASVKGHSKPSVQRATTKMPISRATSQPDALEIFINLIEHGGVK